ncbi:uncharacterized protein AMSG_11233, partial [Thecamonas trahens ATCC 50062]
PGAPVRAAPSAAASVPPLPAPLVGLQPDAVSHKLLVAMYVAARRADDAHEIGKALLDAAAADSSAPRPAYETLTAVVHALAKAKRLDDGVAFAERIAASGYTLHLRHVRSLNSALNHAQDGAALARLHAICATPDPIRG